MAQTVVGLDIGGAGVRAAEVRVTSRRQPVLRRFASVGLPSGAVRSGHVVDRDAVAAALRELWDVGRFSTKDVVVGIANDSVLVRQLDLDWMPPDDFRKALRYQVADSLPFPVDEANLDYYLLDDIDVPANGTNEQRRVARVMLVAASRDAVDRLVGAAQDAGLRPSQVDLLPFALVRAASPVTQSQGDVEAIVDVGADTVTVVVHQAGRPRFVRMLSGVGGDAITRALEEAYGWTRQDAEHTKIVLGVSDPPGETHETGDLTGHPARDMIAAGVHALASEVRATLDFYRGSTTGEQLAHVLLAGNGLRLPGAQEMLQDLLGLPVQPLLVTDRLAASKRPDVHHDALLVVPVGLCLRTVA